MQSAEENFDGLVGCDASTTMGLLRAIDQYYVLDTPDTQLVATTRSR